MAWSIQFQPDGDSADISPFIAAELNAIQPIAVVRSVRRRVAENAGRSK